MAEENQATKEPQGEAAQPPSRVQPAQQITKEPQGKAAQLPSGAQPVQRVTTKNPKKVEAGKRLAESNRKKREAKKQAKLEASGHWRSVNQYYGIGAVIALGVICCLGYYIYRTKKGEQPQGEVQRNNLKPQPQPQTNKSEME